jgi:hypothetical protein
MLKRLCRAALPATSGAGRRRSCASAHGGLRRKDGSGASAAEMRCAGSKCSSLERRSSAWGEAAGNLPTYQRQWVATADRGSPRLRGDSQRRMRRRRGDPVASKACV